MPTTENERVLPKGTLNEEVAKALGWTYAKEWRNVGTWVAPNGTLWAFLPQWETDEGLALQLIKDEEYCIVHSNSDPSGPFLVQLSEIDSYAETLAGAVCEAFLELNKAK